MRKLHICHLERVAGCQLANIKFLEDGPSTLWPWKCIYWRDGEGEGGRGGCFEGRVGEGRGEESERGMQGEKSELGEKENVWEEGVSECVS